MRDTLNSNRFHEDEEDTNLGDLKYIASLHQASLWTTTLTLSKSPIPTNKSDEEKKSPSNDENLVLNSPAKNVTPTINSPFLNQDFVNLISESSGSRVLFATDEWFARAENLLKDGPPIFIPDLYDSQGKVMDGFETRRRREAGHDFCIIKLGSNDGGDVHGIEIDTAHFTGNQAPRISIDAMSFPLNNNEDDEDSMYTWMPGAVKRLAQGGGIQGTGQSVISISKALEACEKFKWTEILPITVLRPGYEETRMHYVPLSNDIRKMAKNVTHIRVNYYPDGGVARLRLWGYPSDGGTTTKSSTVQLNRPPSAEPYPYPELSLSTNGGIGLECSNKHYGIPSNLIQPTYGKDMGDSWETARHPDRPAIVVKDAVTNLVDCPLMDWCILRLGMGGSAKSGIQRIILDTKHFKGNYPESVQVEGCNIQESTDCSSSLSNLAWLPLLPRTRMGPHQEHVFESCAGQLVNEKRVITHVRVSIFPDGGLSRVRVYGEPFQK